MTMAAFSYLTAITNEENRTFRFAIFSVILSVIPFIGLLAGSVMINHFSYAQMFGMFIPVHILGLVYFLRLKEPEKPSEITTNGIDNLAMEESTQQQEQQQTHLSMQQLEIAGTQAVDEVHQKSKNFCAEFFDPTYAVQCVTVVIKERENVLRSLLVFLLAAYFLSYSAAVGEESVLFNFQRKILNWDAGTNALNKAYLLLISTIGTILMTGVVGKLLKVRDIFLALISIILTIVSKFIYFSSTTTSQFFIGTTVDAAGGVRGLAVRSLISQVVASNETSTAFSLMGVLEAIGQFIFNFLYPTIYQCFLEYDIVPMIFMLSIAILILVFIALR